MPLKMRNVQVSHKIVKSNQPVTFRFREIDILNDLYKI